MYNSEPLNLFYSMHDGTSLDTGLEWWRGDILTGYAAHNATAPPSGSLAHHTATFEVNEKLIANLTVRPKFEYDWSSADDQSYFGGDAAFTF